MAHVKDEVEDGHLFLEPLCSSSFDETSQKKVVNMAGDADIKKSTSEISLSFNPYEDLNVQTIKLKNDLNSWKEVILMGRSVLLWDKPWYPQSILGVTTIYFTILWLASPSLLTTISILGLIVTLADYCVPLFAASYFKQEHWTKTKDQQFEDICRNYIVCRAKFICSCQNFYNLRSTKPKMFYSSTAVVLLLLSWVGCCVSNLFLMYAVLSTTLLLPGLEAKGYVRKGRQELNTRFGHISNKICQTVHGLLQSKPKAD